MMNRYALVAPILFLAQDLSAQYCSPTFANGCFSWRTLEVQAGSINWAPGADDCSLSDYSTVSTSVDAGAMLPMRVLNGTWCGCAVWVDWDQSNSFEDNENMYFIYVGGSPSYEYQFGITIPLATATGAYRMRIISAWGSDGFQTSNGNGYGPCGAFQYGDFKDFTLNVNGVLSVTEEADEAFAIAPNPSMGFTTITGLPTTGTIEVIDARGAVVEQAVVRQGRAQFDAQGWSRGVYTVRMSGARFSRRFVVE
ncbi:MAG: T9SS type A sorting domain-containing protein [Flavobacteriales bacterium]|jgi:hypothetical protein|nr:T9SS type A sorting domain-containing protein [Flavobacteriales bacterium]